jgi:hypothetical protein
MRPPPTRLYFSLNDVLKEMSMDNPPILPPDDDSPDFVVDGLLPIAVSMNIGASAADFHRAALERTGNNFLAIQLAHAFTQKLVEMAYVAMGIVDVEKD